MSTITVQDIARDPVAFVNRIESGEALIVVRDDQLVAEVKPLPASKRVARPYGLAAGQFIVPDDFDVPLPEAILRDFEGR